MRAFVAIYPPLEIRENLLQAVKDLLPGEEFNWVKPTNVHLTLKFLGDIEKERLDTLRETLSIVCNQHERFEIKPRGIGAFPSLQKARIVWVGVDKGTVTLRALAEDLETHLAPLGFEEERRRFRPHITLGRSVGRLGKLPEVTESVGSSGFLAQRIDLVKSSPGKGGPVYATLSGHSLHRTFRGFSDRE